MSLLPQPIADELFNTFYRTSDIIITQLTDYITGFGFTVRDITDRDSSIQLIFIGNLIKGSINICRNTRTFTVTATSRVGTFPPGSGRWDVVTNYLTKLKEVDNQNWADDGQ